MGWEELLCHLVRAICSSIPSSIVFAESYLSVCRKFSWRQQWMEDIYRFRWWMDWRMISQCWDSGNDGALWEIDMHLVKSKIIEHFIKSTMDNFMLAKFSIRRALTMNKYHTEKSKNESSEPIFIHQHGWRNHPLSSGIHLPLTMDNKRVIQFAVHRCAADKHHNLIHPQSPRKRSSFRRKPPKVCKINIQQNHSAGKMPAGWKFFYVCSAGIQLLSTE